MAGLKKFYIGEAYNMSELEELEILALAGEPDTFFKLGLAYYYGRSDTLYEKKLLASGETVDRDVAKAMDCFRKADDLGDRRSMFNLGACYHLKEGGANISEAIKWYREAARKKFAPAQHALAACYREGIDVEQNFVKAARYFCRSANQGDMESWRQLSEMYDDVQLTQPLHVVQAVLTVVSLSPTGSFRLKHVAKIKTP
jgi:TPR repeat protein